MKTKIAERIAEVQAEEGATILYACESGSRAWGFASTDSDYDVRFLYIRSPDWYLSIDLAHRRDVIERPIDSSLDLSGWDLQKALRLFRKSNPPLLEWLGSPIVYLDQFGVAARLRELAPQYYSSAASGYHYLHMARGNFREYLQSDVVWRKKYFYVLRPLLAIRWLEADLGIVPTEFSRLVEATIQSEALTDAIGELVEEKRAGHELDYGPRIEVISSFVESELSRLEGARFSKKPAQPPVEPLNQLFQQVLREANGDSG